MLINIDREELLKFGMLVCKHCGWPPNNHFDWDHKPCAHDKNCPGYEEKLRGTGKIIQN